MGEKIPVTVITGFLGSGKTALIGSLLDVCDDSQSPCDVDRIVVLAESGDPYPLARRRVMLLGGSAVAPTAGCACCAVRRELADALRRLFMDALQRRVAGFDHVIVEIAGLADPASVRYTLQYEPFLRDRYRYGGCLAVISGRHGLRDLVSQPEAARQVALSDALWINGCSDPASLTALRTALGQINPLAQDHSAASPAKLASLLFRNGGLVDSVHGRAIPVSRGLWRSGDLQRRTKENHDTGIRVLAVKWRAAPSRAASMRWIEAVLDDVRLGLLKMSGPMRFAGDERCWQVLGVHGQLYPLQSCDSAVGDDVNRLTLILRPAHDMDIEAILTANLPPEGQCCLLTTTSGLQQLQ